MPLQRTARGHRFDFASRACVVCGMLHRERLVALEALCRTCESIRNGVGAILRSNDVPVIQGR